MSNANIHHKVNRQINDIVYVYENLPPLGGGRRTFDAIRRYLPKNTIVFKGFHIKSPNIVSYVFSSIFRSYFFDKCISNIINSKYPLVVFQSWLTNTPYILYLASNPKIYICHEPLREYHDKYIREHQSIKSKIVNIFRYPIYLLDKYLVRKSNATLVANSQFSKSFIKSAYDKDAIIINPGYDSNKYYCLETVKKKNQIISVGSITPLKNQEYIIEVVARINKPNRPIVVLVGNGGIQSYIKRLQKKAKLLEVNLKIRLNISDRTLNREYNKSKLMIYTPINEPYGIVVLEAMATGLPIISHVNGGGFNELLDASTGISFQHYNPNIWATEIIKLINDKKKVFKIHNHNIQIASKHTDKQYALKLYSLIKHL